MHINLCNDRLINTGLYTGDILGERKKLIAQCAGIVQICLYMNSVICERYCQNACMEVQERLNVLTILLRFLYKKLLSRLYVMCFTFQYELQA